MNSESLLILTALSLVFGIYSGVSSARRGERRDNRQDASDMTRVMVKLEDISVGISEIRSELNNVKGDLKEQTERLIVAEQSLKRAHMRLDELNGKQRKRK
ncbi:MAG: hypothetical protein J6Q78_04305 [Clostridia bacterium]|jgi:DNA repair ATPase RecN|nr:hypothetical protein [Clostridia bacterium]